MAGLDELMVEKVLTVVEQVPPGRVVAYGQIGEIVGIGPRFVGNVLAAYGSGVTWWRVVNADGDLRADLLSRARAHWAEEGIAVKPNGRGCRLAEYQANLGELAGRYADAIAAVLAAEAEPCVGSTHARPTHETMQP